MKTRISLVTIIISMLMAATTVFADHGDVHPTDNLFMHMPPPERAAMDAIENDQIGIKFDERTLDAMRNMGLDEELIRRLGSGDIAGNGGGRLEADFHYAYTLIPKLIKDCVESPICPLMPEEQKIINDIWLLTVVNNVKKHKFVFLNGKDAEDLFFDEHDQQVRVAVTGFERYAPIFINLDMIYSDADVLNHMGRIIQIIIHEVGHQTGVKSHSVLDSLGGKIRNFFARETFRVDNNVGGTDIKVITTNFNSPYINSVTTINWSQWANRGHGGSQIDLTKEFAEKAKCEGAGRKLNSFKVSNLHWGRVKQEGTNYVLPLKGWIDFKCEDINTVHWTEEADFVIKLKFEYVQLPAGRIMLYRGSELEVSR